MLVRALREPSAVLLLTIALAGCGAPEQTSGGVVEQAPATAPAGPAAAPTPHGAPGRDWELRPGAGTEVAAFLDRLAAGIGDTGSVHLRAAFTTADGELSFEADTSYGPRGAALRAVVPVRDVGNVLVLVVDGAGYVGVPGEEERYFRLPADDRLLGDLTQGELSPLASVQRFEAATLGVTDLGWGAVDRVSVAHLRLRVDTATLLQDESRDLPDQLDYDVWLDEFHRLRRVGYRLGDVSTVVDYSDWGATIPIEAPRGDQLVEPPAGFGGGSARA